MQIIFNGDPRGVTPGTSVAKLLAQLQVVQQHVAVEVNLELVPRARYAEHILTDGDRLEIVTLVGGG